MRSVIQKSKVHTINKMAKIIKDLKEKKGTKIQLAKNQKKATRIIYELLEIKV